MLQLVFNPNSSPDPLIRLGLINPEVDDLKNVCCNVAAYHALKAKIRANEFSPPSSTCMHTHTDILVSGGASLRQCWSVFAEACQTEAGELAIKPS